MRRTLLISSVFAALAMAFPSVSYGHGGQYRGPGDTVPPGAGGGGDTRPPGNPGGPGTPGPGAPTTGGRPGAGTTGGPQIPGGRTGGNRPTTGAMQKRQETGSYDQWEFWWEQNKEPYLALKSRLQATGATTGNAGVAMGRGNKRAVSVERISSAEFEARILPVLLGLLEREDQGDIVDSAVLAIARSLSADRANLAFDAIVKTLRHDQDSAKQSATLSLGVLGSPEARPILIELMKDTPKGRDYLNDTKSVPSILRGFAAISLGMIGNPEDIPALKDAVDKAPSAERDLISCALIALGMYEAQSADVVPYMLQVMDRSDMDRVLRSLAPIALSRLEPGAAATAGIPSLLSKVKSDKTDDDMMRSCVIALGKLASMSDGDVVDALLNTIANHNDQQSQNFAYIALGEIAARDTQGYENNKQTHQKVERFLSENAKTPKKLTQQPWAALALGIYAREFQDNTSLYPPAVQRLSEAFEETNNPSNKAAIAIALGLLNAPIAAPALHNELKDTKNQELGGYIAVALGLMNYRDAAEDMRAMITKKGIEFKFRLNLARGLGLMSDVESIQTLVDLLADSKTLSETASIAQAIGLIGNSQAIEPLSRLAENKDEKDLVRAFSAVALGLLAEKTELPWNAKVSVGLNYRSKTDALSEILDIL